MPALRGRAMSDGLTITLQGWEQLERAFRQAPDVVREELTAFAHGATQLLRSEVVDRTPAAMGTLRASISAQVDRLADGVLGVVGTPSPYAVPVELGTRPHFPPVQALEDWVRQKLGLSGKEAHSAAFLIARKISKKGTKGHFMFRDAYQANAGEIQQQFDAAAARIVARIGGA